MAKKTRYIQYALGLQKMHHNRQRHAGKSNCKSILQKLKQLKGQEFRMTIPIGGTDEE